MKYVKMLMKIDVNRGCKLPSNGGWFDEDRNRS